MTIAVAQSSAQAWASATSVTTTGITTTSGSLLALVYLAYRGGGMAGVSVTPSDSKSNTWTAGPLLVGDSSTYGAIWYANAGTRGAAHTATVTLDATAQQSLVLVEITGASGALNQSASDSQTTGTATVTSSATTEANCLVLGAAVTRGDSGTINWAANGTITGSNGTDIYVDNDGATHTAGYAVWYRIVSATGAQTAARSHDATISDWTALVAAFVEASGGGRLVGGSLVGGNLVRTI